MLTNLTASTEETQEAFETLVGAIKGLDLWHIATIVLLLLACMGLTPLRPWKKALLLLCMAVNAWGPLYWNCFYR